MFDSNTEQANFLLALVGAVVGPITGQIGANCSPISAIGIAGNSWFVMFLEIFATRRTGR